MKTLVAVVVSALAAQAFAHSLDMNKVGFRGRGGTDVPSGSSVEQSEPIILDSTAKFQKTGAGTLEIPFSKIDRKAPYSLVANEGKLRLSVDGEPAALPSAPEACQKAAYWVDTSSVVTTNGEDGTVYVARWCDVREPAATRDLAATPTKVYATPRWFHAPAENQGVPPVFTNKDGKAAVYFGGHLAGKWMEWSSRFSDVHHVFLVHGCYDTWGAAIGCSWQNRYGGFVPPFAWPTTVRTSQNQFTKHFWAAPLAEADAFTVTAFLDGMPLDVETVPPKIGFQLLECKYAGALTKADDFFYSSYAEIGGSTSEYKQGGDYISEAIVFNVALSEAERLEIERYLMKKWNLDNNGFAYDTSADAKDVVVPAPVGSVGVAEGAQVEVAVGEGDSTPPLTFSGEGDVVKTGAGTLVVGASAQETPFAGTFSLQAGDVIARCGALPPVRLAGGVKYTAEAHKGGSTANVANTKEAGLRLSCMAAGPRTLAVKDGVGWMRANGVSDEVTCVKVESGVLQLEAHAASPAYFAGGAVTAVVANADFELSYTANEDGRSPILPSDYSGEGANGWRCLSGNVRYASTQGSYWKSNTGGRYSRPSGTQVIMAVGASSLETMVTFLQAGRYELSFDCRSNSGRATGNLLNDCQQVSIKLQRQGGSPETIATFAANDGPFQHCRFRLPEVEAGQYALQFECTVGTSSTTYLDDVSVVLVGEREEVPAFAIPHGDFESANGGYTDFDARNTSEGWAFGQDGTYGETEFELNPPAGIVGRSRWYNESGWWPIRPFLFNVYDAPLGGSCLLFNSSGGTATTSFTAPAGEFRLRAGVSMSAGYLKVGTAGGKYNVRNGSVIEAVLTLADDTVVNLGTVTSTAHLMELKTWPVGFEIAEPQVVTLTLRQTSQSTAFVDDLVFVGDSRGCEGNLVKNPGFEREFANWSVKAGNTSTWPVLYSQSPALYYGYAAAGGMRGTRMSGVGAFLRQNITFPSKGLYRLRVFARPRSEDNAKSRGNLEFDLVPAGSTVTNVIGRTGVGDVMPRYLQFVEFNYLFRVDVAGDYAFVIRKLGEDGSRDTYVDDVSITCVKEELADFRIPEYTHIKVAEGAMLRLDFTNTVTTGTMTLGGVPVRGLVNEETYPEYISGPGSLMAVGGKGVIMIVF